MTNTNTNTTTTNFQAGRTYFCRSICDHNCVFTYTVVRRTAKSVWIKESGKHASDKVTRRTVKMDHSDQTEYVLPEGSYSMCPFLSADKVCSVC